MKDFWDDMGDVYDPLDLFDFDDDGEHDFLETMTAIDSFDDDSAEDGFGDDFGESFDDGFSDKEEGALSDGDFAEDSASEDDGDDYYVDRKRDEEEELINYFKAIPFRTKTIKNRKISAVSWLFYLIKRADDMDGHDLDIKRCLFILQNDCLIADYMDADNGFEYSLKEAILESGLLPADFKENYGENYYIYELLEHCLDMSPKLFLDVWQWIMKEFAPYEEFDPEFIGEMIVRPFFMYIDESAEKEHQYYGLLLQYFSKHPEMLDKMISRMKSSHSSFAYLLHEALTHGHKEFVGRVFALLFPQKNMPANEKTWTMKVLVRVCCQDEDIGCDEIKFLLGFMQDFKQSQNFLIRRESPKWEADLREKLEDLEWISF